MGFADEAAAVREIAIKAHDGLPGKAGEPIRVLAPDGTAEDWIVPVLEGPDVIGFYQLTGDRRVKRFSELATSNAFTIDRSLVLATAQAALSPNEVVGMPVLSYHGNPDRLAWSIPVEGPGGRATIYVAGGVAWRAPSDGPASTNGRMT